MTATKAREAWAQAETELQREPPGARSRRASRADALPERVGRYEVCGALGEGAMGRVYRAWDPWLGREVAVKVLKEAIARDPLSVVRFQREAQALARLSHAALVAVHDVASDYIVLELVDGETLTSRLRRELVLAPSVALRILAPLADALDHVHAVGIVHGDVKPSNVMVLPDGTGKLMDFSVAHLSWAPITRTGELIGAPAYFAPEQIGRGRISPASDQFSLAAVAFEMLAGRRAFVEANLGALLESIVLDPPPPASGLNPRLPRAVDQVLARALHKEPQERYPTTRSFFEALDEACGSSGRTGVSIASALFWAWA